MTTEDKNPTAAMASRLKLAIAGLVLAGALAGGTAVVADSAPVGAEDTTETAHGWWASARSGLSWQ